MTDFKYDFTFRPDIDAWKSDEDFVMYHAIFGFSAGYPVCCVIDFIKKHYHERAEIATRVGVQPLTLMTFALCDGEHDDEIAWVSHRSWLIEDETWNEIMVLIRKAADNPRNESLNSSVTPGSTRRR